MNKLLVITAVAMMIFGGGGACARRMNVPPDMLEPGPAVADPAMQNRQWEPSAALYANTSVVAGPTGFMYGSRENRQQWEYALSEAPVFLMNVVLLPYAVYQTPPRTKVE